MNAKAFFVDALSSALDLGIATPDDVLRHVTPDVLANHLPRPLWARLLTACVGAPRVDAQLVVETIGVSNLCEHVPAPVIWAVVAEVASRALGGEIPARPVTTSAAPVTAQPAAASKSEPTPLPITSPPPPEPPKPQPARPTAMGPSIPSPLVSTNFDEPTRTIDEDTHGQPARARTATSQRFRASNTGIGRLANNQRRPQAQAPAPEPVEPAPEPPRVRRGQTEVEEIETEVASGSGDWRSSLAVEDDQLVDWSASEETVTHAGDDPVFGRKR